MCSNILLSCFSVIFPITSTATTTINTTSKSKSIFNENKKKKIQNSLFFSFWARH